MKSNFTSKKAWKKQNRKQTVLEWIFIFAQLLSNNSKCIFIHVHAIKVESSKDIVCFGKRVTSTLNNHVFTLKKDSSIVPYFLVVAIWMLAIQLIVIMFDVLPVMMHWSSKMHLVQTTVKFQVAVVNEFLSHVQCKLRRKIGIQSTKSK